MLFVIYSIYSHITCYILQALGLRRDDTFSKTMLDYALDQMMAEVPPCPGKYNRITVNGTPINGTISLSMEPYHCQWDPITVNGTLSLSMGPYHCQWDPITVNGTLSLPMKPYHCQWNPITANETLSLPMEPYHWE